MTELTTVLQLLLLSLWCHGWHHLFSPGEALYFISKGAYKDFKKAESEKEYQQKKINSWYISQLPIAVTDRDKQALQELHNEKQEANTQEFERKIYFLKPLFLCSICFASIYGTVGYLLLNYTTWGIFPVAVIGLISVNKIMQKYIG